MKAMGLAVSEKKISVCFFFPIVYVSLWEQLTPRVGPFLPIGVGRIYKEDNNTLLHIKYESSGPCGFGVENCFCFSHCKSMGDNDPRGGAIFDPRGMLGRIYKEGHYTLLQTKYESCGSCDFGEDCFIFFPMTPSGGACLNPWGTVGRIYIEDHHTLLHRKYESSGPCGFGEKDFFLCFSNCKSMGAICCHGNQTSDPTWPKT